MRGDERIECDERRVEERVPLPARDYEILVVLTASRLHGYGIAKALEARIDGSGRIEPANLYRRLRKLRKAGLIGEEAIEPAEPGGVKRVFEITPLGRRVLECEAVRLRALVHEAQALRIIS